MIGPGSRIRYRGREVAFEELPPEVQRQLEQLSRMAETPVARFMLRALGIESLPGMPGQKPAPPPRRQVPARRAHAKSRIVAASREPAVQRSEPGGDLGFRLVLAIVIGAGLYLAYRLFG
jgi:hypothetical protein